MAFAAILLSAWLAIGTAAQTQVPSPDSFPMSLGTSWVYRGIVHWSNGRDGGPVTKVTWKTEVRKVIRRGTLFAAVINGFPSDLDLSDGDPKPGDSLLIRTGKDDYYLIGGDGAHESIKTFQDRNAALDGLLNADDLFLRLPLKQAAKFCDPQGMARDDGMYCWVVTSAEQISLNDVKGLAPGAHQAYEIRYVTNPDDTTYTFVPGVGVVSYEYHHHGSVADTELKLVEFHPGKWISFLRP